MPPSLEAYKGRELSARRVTGGRSGARTCAPDLSGLVTVVTVTFNSAGTIDRTIDSITAQSYPKIQYVVIDGVSTDGTVDRLRSRNGDVDLWISEPDLGISDAFNKGIALAAGEYVALVNADDWLDPDHLSLAARALQNSEADFVFGDLVLHPDDREPPYTLLGDRNYARGISYSMPQINHPTIVCRRRVYEDHGLFDLSLRTAMDYEWLLRGHTRGVRGAYVAGMVSHMSMGGTSHVDYSRGFREVRDISINYGYSSVLAQFRYGVRLLKSRLRRTLKLCVPARLYQKIRQKVNPQYKLGDGRSP
jgi:glycosyltransferase involved in cell wall biosynthesis